jgi:aryl-alcohol dehydrogenase-like predicted oxidoreductase
LTILEAAERLNIKVFTSIPLFQSRLLKAQLPDYMGLTDQVAKLVQVIRSSPSVIAPLIGYKKPQHIEQDLKISNIPPLNDEEFKNVIDTLIKGNS